MADFEFATKEEVQNRLLGLQNLLATIKPMGQKEGCRKYDMPVVKFGGCPSTNRRSITLPLAMVAAKSYDRAQIIHFLAHELGHVFFTPETAPKRFKEVNAQFKKLGDKLAFEFLNVVEDIRVDFLGDKIIKSSKTFGEYTLLSTLTPEYQKMTLAKAPLERVFGLAMILEGYMEIYTSAVLKRKVEPFLNALKAKLESYISKRRLKWYEPDYKEAAQKVKEIVCKLSSCSENWYWDMETTQYAFNSMCNLFKKYFKEAAEEEKEQQGNDKGSDSDDKSDDSQKSNDKSDNSEESEDKSEGSNESDDKSDDSQESEDESEGSESEDKSDDSEESEDESEGSNESDDDSEDSEESEGNSKGSESDDKSDDSQETEDKSDDLEEAEAKRKGETAIMRGFRESQQIMQEDGNEVVDLLQHTGLIACGDLFDRHSSGANVFTFDNSKGAKGVKSQLEKASEAAKEVCSADYQQSAVGYVKPQAYWDSVNNQIAGKCTNLVSKLREALKAYTPKQYTKPVKAGFKLNGQQIHKIGQGQYVPKPFMKKDKGVDLSTEIVFLADISGSMGLDINNDHTGICRYDMMAASLKILFNSLQRVGNNNLLINLATFGSKVKVIKRAKDPFSVLEKKMPDVSGSTEGRGATLWAIDVLRKSKAHRKIIICLTDGGWDSTCNINPKAIHALGIETYGIVFNNIYEAEKMIQHKYIPTFDRLFQVGGNLEEFYLKFLTELLSNTPNHA